MIFHLNIVSILFILSKQISANYGRFSSVCREISENLSKNIEITSSDYLVPKLNETFDLSDLIERESVHHEKLWRYFSQSSSVKGNFREKQLDRKMDESKMG